MKPGITLVVLAAEKELRLLRHQSPAGPLEEVVHRHARGYPDSDVSFADTPTQGHAGRAHFGHGERRAAEDAELTRFAAHVIEETAREWVGGGYGRIVLAASPRLLGHLRDHMPKPIAAHVTADMAKDLVKNPIHDLPAALAPLLRAEG